MRKLLKPPNVPGFLPAGPPAALPSYTRVHDLAHTDISAAQPTIATRMRARLEQINATVFSPNRGTVQQALGCEVGVNRYHGYWGPFLDLGSE